MDLLVSDQKKLDLLDFLYEKGERSINQISRKLNTNWNSTFKYVLFLKELGLVQYEKKNNRIIYVKIAEEEEVLPKDYRSKASVHATIDLPPEDKE